MQNKSLLSQIVLLVLAILAIIFGFDEYVPMLIGEPNSRNQKTIVEQERHSEEDQGYEEIKKVNDAERGSDTANESINDTDGSLEGNQKRSNDRERSLDADDGANSREENILYDGNHVIYVGDEAILDAFNNERSDVLIDASGTIEKILPDDLQGSRHQRFIVRLESKHTILISHNIDLAPKAPLKEGDWVDFRGEYEWNKQGGVVHWTHHDPKGRHADGWILHKGEFYE